MMKGIKGKEHKIIWLTGPSGCGKTTIAENLKFKQPIIVLDGDDMRRSVSLGLGFSKEDREENNYRVARLAKELSRQADVVISSIAPMEKVRNNIYKICSPIFVYIKRDVPKRDGHFYEEPTICIEIDNNNNTIEESVDEVEKILLGTKVKPFYSLFIGRYQPLHEGHIKLIRSVLNEGKKVCVGLRDTGIDNNNNPYTLKERIGMFAKEFKKESFEGNLVVMAMPDIEEVCYGRKVGWGIRQIILDKETESISATEIRKNGNKKD